MTTPHVHDWIQANCDDNDDRTRTKDICACGAVRFGCFAKRLGEPGTAQLEGFPIINGEVCGAWGPVGRWLYDIDTRGIFVLAAARLAGGSP